MDELLQDIETELKALKPQRPAAHLLNRIERELMASGAVDPARVRRRYTTATNLKSWKWFGWRAAGLAAAVALLATVGIVRVKEQTPARGAPATGLANSSRQEAPSPSPEPLDRYQPVAATNVLYALQDEGPVYVDGDKPARRLRYRYLDTYTWKNSRGNAAIKWSLPRDEIRVLPASMN